MAKLVLVQTTKERSQVMLMKHVLFSWTENLVVIKVVIIKLTKISSRQDVISLLNPFSFVNFQRCSKLGWPTCGPHAALGLLIGTP